MLDLVPLARPGRKMTHLDVQPRGIGEALQLELPQPQAPAIAPAGVGRDQDAPRPRIEPPAFLAPPPTDRRDRKFARIVIGPQIDKPRVASDVVDAIRIHAWHLRRRKVVALHVLRRLRRPPLLARIAVVADELLLLRVCRNHGEALRQVPFHGPIDVPKLRVAIRMVLALFGLPIALEAVVQVVQQLRHFRVTDRIVLPPQRGRNHPRALAGPPQGRLGIAPGIGIDERFEGLEELRAGDRHAFASPTRPPDAAGGQRYPGLEFADALADRFAREAARATDERDAAVP